MVRDDLYITIPSFFRCPISLDVMKSPVSLCTGVTYDRASIQRWLDNGNNTCPATMQVLQSKEIVPNKTLQRLIQVWSDSVRVNSSTESVSVPSRDQIKAVIEEIMETKKQEKLFEFLPVLVRFARESEANREFLVKIDGFVAMVISLLSHNDNVNIKCIEQVVMVLSLVLIKVGDQDQQQQQQLTNSILKTGLSTLLMVLQQGSVEESRIGCIKILEFISIDAESKLLIAEKEGLVSELIRLISQETESCLIEACLSCLITISMPKRVKLKLVYHNVITELWRLLTEPSSSVSITEKALKLLEMMSTVKEGRVEICQESRCVQAVVHKMLKVSNAATEHAVTILWSICYLFRDQKAQEAVTNSNGLTKILLLMQSNCSPAVKHMSSDLLKIFRVNSKSCLSSYDTKTTHIMPF